MPNATEQALNALVGKLSLLAELEREKADLEERLRKAEEQSDSVPKHIFAKVKGEYEDRLKEINGKLVPIQKEVDGARDNIKKDITKIEEELKDLGDKIAEAEFRCRVGEFGENELNRIVSPWRSSLAEKEKLRAEWEEVLADLEEGRSPRELAEAAAHESSPSPERETPRQEKGKEQRAGAEAPGRSSEKTEPAPAAPTSGSCREEASIATQTATEEESFENPREWMQDLVRENEDDRETPESYRGDEPDPLSVLADPSDEGSPSVEEVQGRPEGEFQGTPNLIVSCGPNSGKKIPLLPVTITIGREHDNNIVLKDEDVCRYHARIVYREGEYVLSPLEESTGAWINDEKVRGDTALKDADRIRIGNTELIFDWR